MKPAIAFLRHGSTVEGREVFLVTMLGKAFIDLDLDTAVIVPRGNITTTSEQYLLEKNTTFLVLHSIVNELSFLQIV